MTLLADIDSLVSRGGAFSPRWGWHDDHRESDGTPAYLPALQQVRNETEVLLEVLSREFSGTYDDNVIDGRCLQLGLGECAASHRAWMRVFGRKVVTLDWGAVWVNNAEFKGTDISTPQAVEVAAINAPYDFLFIDAGHSAEDARRDHANYGPLIRQGGIIAFHDALRRPGFEEVVQVWRYLETLRESVSVIGTEVGVAWLRV